jgi:transposase-like protein
MAHDPETLQEAIRHFSDPANCREYIVRRRWPNGVTCPRCGGDKVAFLDKYNRWQCSSPHKNRQFTAKTGTIFEDSPIGLDKWLAAMWLIVNCKNGVSSYEIARDLGLTQKTAWFLDHRIRLSLHSGSFDKLSGEVEVDETFIGGKARNMHATKRRQRIHKPGPHDKVPVMGMVERGGRVVAFPVATRKKGELQKHVRDQVEAGAAIFSDELPSYDGLQSDYRHAVIDHAVEYVRGNVHTNTMENFWSLLKRGLHGTYVSVEPFHLFRYLDEQAYRYNNRKLTDAERFSITVEGIVGKRVTWDRLTGKEADRTAPIN